MKSIPLIAARKLEIGTVTISNDASNVFVRFQSDVIPGCLLYELRAHLAADVAESPLAGGIPRARGNLIPGKFSRRASTTGVLDHTLTIPILPAWRTRGVVWGAAHATAGDSLRPVGVVTVRQGTKRNGKPVAPDRADPAKALCPECPASWRPGQPVTFFTLGFGGQLTVDFGRLLDSAEFARLTCWEITSGNHMTEKIRLEVALDPAGPWTPLAVEPTNGRPGSLALITVTNVAVVGVPRFRYVRISDSTGVPVDPSLPEPCYEDGFDLDGICAQLPDRETAWAVTGEPTAGWTADRGGGSWGEVFSYSLE